MGEIILERVLERSGLTKGQEYEREEVVEGADRSVQRPDVILHLPDNKHIIIEKKNDNEMTVINMLNKKIFLSSPSHL